MLSAIVQKVTGMKLVDYLRPRLFEPLGIEKLNWETCPKGINIGGWGLSITTEAIARFGQLYLQKGLWEGKRILPEAWVEAATSKQVSNDSETKQRLAAGLRLPVLALPAQGLPRRRGFRAVLHRHARAGGGAGDHFGGG